MSDQLTITNTNASSASSIELSANVVPNLGTTYFDVMNDADYNRIDRVSKPVIHISANFNGILSTISGSTPGSVLNIGTNTNTNNVFMRLSNLSHQSFQSRNSYKIQGVLQLPNIPTISTTNTQAFTMAGY